MKSLVIGISSVDVLIHVPEIRELQDDLSLWATNVTTSIGSTGAGKALCLDVLGSSVTLLTDLANDQEGDRIRSFFATTNVTLHPLLTDKTLTHTNLMHSQGKRISITTSSPTIVPAIHPDIDRLIQENDVIFLNINQSCRDYIPVLKRYNKPILVDIHDYDEVNPYHQDFIDAGTIIVASGVNIKNHTTFMRNLIEAGKELVIVTRGSDGLWAMDSTFNEYSLAGYTAFEYVDSNGAGDSFCAGFMLEYHRTNDLLEALKFGTICGGLACTSYDLFHRKASKKMVQNLIKKVSF